jgi:hypothetical protein
VNSTRWRQINDLFHAALDREPATRDAFLDTAARQDPDLVREVRSLLASSQRAGGFLDEPAWGIGAHLVLDDDRAPVEGRQIGAYVIEREIGRGGMGVVYAARDTKLGREVALKALAPEYARDPVRRERLTREARAAAALSHPAIATIFALEEMDDSLYLVSELVDGRTLREELRDGALPREKLLDTLMQVASALAAAHARGIVHRDLKPENVIRRIDGQIKVLDFGLARFGPGRDTPTLTRLTVSGMALGTPGYMAPEQLSGGTVDVRADVFAFGIVAWELATGEHPFGADAATLLARMTELMQGRTLPISRSLPVTALQPIVRRCLHARAEERYPSARELLEDLRSIAAVAPQASEPPQAPAAFWWWQFHQAAMAVVTGLTPIPVWLVRHWAAEPYGMWTFFATLVLATASVTLRGNLLFAARVYPSTVPAHRARLHPVIAAAEACLTAVLLASAALVAGPHDVTAALLVSVAIVIIASLGLIEPTTTVAAGLGKAETRG